MESCVLISFLQRVLAANVPTSSLPAAGCQNCLSADLRLRVPLVLQLLNIMIVGSVNPLLLLPALESDRYETLPSSSCCRHSWETEAGGQGTGSRPGLLSLRREHPSTDVVSGDGCLWGMATLRNARQSLRVLCSQS